MNRIHRWLRSQPESFSLAIRTLRRSDPPQADAALLVLALSVFALTHRLRGRVTCAATPRAGMA